MNCNSKTPAIIGMKTPEAPLKKALTTWYNNMDRAASIDIEAEEEPFEYLADAAEDLLASLNTPEPGTSSTTLPDEIAKVEPGPSADVKASKPKVKPRKPPASKAKAKPKPKPKAGKASTAPKARLAQLKAAPGSSRGRSTSETPTPSVVPGTPDPQDDAGLEEDPDEDQERDDKLYCLCQTVYDEGKLMIACDKCDEWYHPTCVGLEGPMLELVDTFFCHKCVAVNPSLVTSYKASCARSECSRPARLPLSKYCSNACGIVVVMARVDAWNGDIDHLMDHPSIVEATPREGILLGPSLASPAQSAPLPNDNTDIRRQLDLISSEVFRVSADLKAREELRRALQGRLELFDRAAGRRKVIGDTCGFDARLIFDEYAWGEWLDDGGWPYLFPPEDPDSEDHQEEMEDARWFCARKRKCDMHHGWEEVKFADFELETGVVSHRLTELERRHSELNKRKSKLESQLAAREATAALLAKHRSSMPLRRRDEPMNGLVNSNSIETVSV